MDSNQNLIQRTTKELTDKLLAMNVPRYALLKALEQAKKNVATIDYNYLYALLFPDCSPPSRIPCRFSQGSALFTHKFSLYINTGLNGSGYLSFLPLDTNFYCIYTNDTSAIYDGNPNNNTQATIKYYRGQSNSRWIQDNFATVRLIGASIRVSYTGSVEQEAGFLTASHVLDRCIGGLSDDTIENGFYCTRARPSEGVRLVYTPRDNADTDFIDQNYVMADSQESTNQSLIPSTELQGFTSTINVIRSYEGSVVADANGVKTLVPATIWGTGSRRLSSITPYQLAVNWRGLPAAQDWIRIDVDRHFEGVPRQIIRDLLSVDRADANEDALNAVKDLQEIEMLWSSKLKDAELIKAQFENKIADQLGRDLPKFGRHSMNITGVAQSSISMSKFAHDSGNSDELML